MENSMLNSLYRFLYFIFVVLFFVIIDWNMFVCLFVFVLVCF